MTGVQRTLGRAPAVVPALALAAALVAAPAAAQPESSPRPRPELRVDGFAGRAGAVQAGAGIVVEAGLYARLGVVGAVGTSDGPRGWGTGGRAELVGRYLLDPLGMQRRGIYLGGGLGPRWAPGDRPRWNVHLVLGVEGRSGRRVVPAFEVGVGGGVRAGLVLRPGRVGRR